MMEAHVGFRPGVKVFLFWVIFLVFYGLYKVAPVFPLSIVCGITESNFQHYKSTFFTFLILAVLEYLVYRKNITDAANFWYLRVMIATFAPWMVFLLWYISPAIYGDRMPNIPLEIVYSNAMTVLAGYFAVTFEHEFAGVKFSTRLRAIVITLALVSLLLYMVFTFSHLPWADVFIEPRWR